MYTKDYITYYLNCVDNDDRENLRSMLLWKFKYEFYLNGYTLLILDEKIIKIVLIKNYFETTISIDIMKFSRSLKLKKIL